MRRCFGCLSCTISCPTSANLPSSSAHPRYQSCRALWLSTTSWSALLPAVCEMLPEPVGGLVPLRIVIRPSLQLCLTCMLEPKQHMYAGKMATSRSAAASIHNRIDPVLHPANADFHLCTLLRRFMLWALPAMSK